MSYNLNGPDDGRPITWERDAGDALQDKIEADAAADQERELFLQDTAAQIARHARQIAGDPRDAAFDQRLQNTISERHPELSDDELTAVAEYVRDPLEAELELGL